MGGRACSTAGTHWTHWTHWMLWTLATAQGKLRPNDTTRRLRHAYTSPSCRPRRRPPSGGHLAPRPAVHGGSDARARGPRRVVWVPSKGASDEPGPQRGGLRAGCVQGEGKAWLIYRWWCRTLSSSAAPRPPPEPGHVPGRPSSPRPGGRITRSADSTAWRRAEPALRAVALAAGDVKGEPNFASRGPWRGHPCRPHGTGCRMLVNALYCNTTRPNAVPPPILLPALPGRRPAVPSALAARPRPPMRRLLL